MRSIAFLLLISFVFIGVSCADSSGETETEDTAAADTTAEETTVEAAEAVVAESGENYEIVITDAEPTSPRKEMRGTIGGAEVVINYGSPSVKGRQIYGDLEPYGEVWRTGANEATTFEVTEEVMIEGETLPAGKYGLFTIPGEDEWVVIFNQNADQWGDYDYSESDDVLRVTVTPEAIDARETLDFVVEGDAVVLKWDTVAVPFTVGAAG